MTLTKTRAANFIGGGWLPSTSESMIEVVNPTTEQVIGAVVASNQADVDAAVAAATRALPAWSATTPSERAVMLRRIGASLADRSGDLAGLIAMEIGSPLAFAAGTQVGLPIKVINGMADIVDEYRWEERIGPSLIVHESAGVVGAITPWNYPLHQLVAKVAAALGAGCTVVAKPSEVAPLSALVLAEVLTEVGLPAGVCNIVTGFGTVVGEAIASHGAIDAISLTGSPQAGRRVMELAAPTAKRVTLELGGKSASVVLDDVDVESVISGSVVQCFRNSGQNCSALSRLVVPNKWMKNVEEIARSVAESFRVGDPFDPDTEMGPVVSATQRERVLGYVRVGLDEGARLVAGGVDPPTGLTCGYFVRPTVFSGVRPDMRIAQEEIFGPVLCILGYDDDDEAISIANNSRYGLAGAVWSADPARAERVARRLRTGRVVVNGGQFNAVAPFGGYGLSGVGRELGRYGLEEFLEVKTLQC